MEIVEDVMHPRTKARNRNVISYLKINTLHLYTDKNHTHNEEDSRWSLYESRIDAISFLNPIQLKMSYKYLLEKI